MSLVRSRFTRGRNWFVNKALGPLLAGTLVSLGNGLGILAVTLALLAGLALSVPSFLQALIPVWILPAVLAVWYALLVVYIRSARFPYLKAIAAADELDIESRVVFRPWLNGPMRYETGGRMVGDISLLVENRSVDEVGWRQDGLHERACLLERGDDGRAPRGRLRDAMHPLGRLPEVPGACLEVP